ncbi:MAG: ATP-binding cassette domain-containing protein, partial [Amylibacter sp.]
MNTIETPNKRDDTSGLVVRNIKKSFKQRRVLENVSLKLGRGEVVALLGPNGAGKTTCFYSVVGLIRPDAGTVLVNGRDITQLPM